MKPSTLNDTLSKNGTPTQQIQHANKPIYILY